MTLNWIEINPSEIRKSSITYRRIFDKCILCEEKEDREIHTAEHVAMKCKSFKCASASATGSCPVQYKQIICSFDGNTSTTRSAHHTAPFEQITPKKERRIKDDVAEVVRHLVTLHPNHSPTRLRILVHMECTRLGVVICESQKQILGLINRIKAKHKPEMNLRELQDYLNHYMCGVEDIQNISDDSPFVYEIEKDEFGDMQLGVGSENNPFQLFITSKSMLKKLMNVDDTDMVFHVDATFKIFRLGYKIITLGVSDRERKIHLLGFCIVSHLKIEQWLYAFTTLKVLFVSVCGREFKPSFLMSDGEEAIHTTVCMAFPDITKLYCYFHFMKLVKTEFKNNPEYQNLIKFVKNCHFARDSNEYDIIWDKYMVENDKRSNPPIVVPNHPVEDVPIPVEDVPNHQVEDVPIPVEDVPKQKICDWLNYICYIPKFMNWQAYHTPCGYATTNNPLESFNSTIKKVLTSRELLPIPTLLDRLFRYIKWELSKTNTFTTNTAIPSTRTVASAKSKFKMGLFIITRSTESRNHFRCIQLISVPLNAIDNGTQNYYIENDGIYTEFTQTVKIINQNPYIERKGMPEEGWLVNTLTNTCGCLIHQKDGSCVHICAVKMKVGHAFPGYTPPAKVFISQRRSGVNRHSHSRISRRQGTSTSDRGRATTTLRRGRATATSRVPAAARNSRVPVAQGEGSNGSRRGRPPRSSNAYSL